MKKLKIVIIFLLLCNAAKASTNAEKAIDFFNKLDKDHLELVTEFYDTNVKFQDPVHRLQGSNAVKAYYEGLYKNVKSIHFEYSKTISEGETLVLVWKMFLETPNLNGGKLFSVDGNSVIEFDKVTGKAIRHRDYFDMGEFIYERVPVLKSIIKMIKSKLSGA